MKEYYPTSLGNLRTSWLVTGAGVGMPSWDSGWRAELVYRLEILVRQLWTRGYDRIFVGGSFVERKEHPGDIDGFFECPLADLASGRVQASLNRLDPYHVWQWRTRLPDPATGILHPIMWHVHRVELFPDTGRPSPGLPDQQGNPQTWSQWFRQTRQWHSKGILQIVR
jgi:hypothetical protein